MTKPEKPAPQSKPSSSSASSATPPVATPTPPVATPTPPLLPTIGRIVHYRLSEEDAKAVNKRRDAYNRSRGGWTDGPQAHVGNHAEAGQVLPMIIVVAWGGDCVNGQVLLDGNDSLWVTSVVESPTDNRSWFWPPKS